MRRLKLDVLFLLAAFVGHDAWALKCPVLVPSTAATENAGYTHGLLWRVVSKEGRSSHVFGTIHISDPRVTELPPGVVDALSSSESFGMEVLLDGQAMLQMSHAMYYGAGETLQARLDAELFDSTVKLLANYGVTAQAAKNLKPWAAYTTLSLPPGRSAMPLDLLLLTVAKQGGKTTFGLESIAEQVAVFDGLTLTDQRDLLTEAVCHYGEFQTDLETMIEYYVARDLDGMMRLAMRYRSPLHDRLMDALLWQRNRRMVQRMQPSLSAGSAFIAIGALHLPGVGGVLDLLSEQGYTVTPVY